MRSVKCYSAIQWITVSFLLLLASWSSGPVMAAQDAGLCPNDRINKNQFCTAKDVQVVAAGVGTGQTGLTCLPGGRVDVAVAGTLTVRNGTRYDMALWVATDGKPLNVRGGQGGAPDEGGAQTCEVLPLPSQPITADGLSNIVIDNLDTPTTPYDCYDSSAGASSATTAAFALTSNRDTIINGLVDSNNDGFINTGPEGDDTTALPVFGAQIVAGEVDLNSDGVIDAVNDTGVWNGYAVDTGVIDVTGDGVHGADDDDSEQSFNDQVSMECIANDNGKLNLETLASWSVDSTNICSPANPDTFDLEHPKCTTSSGEVEIQVVGKVTIKKSASPADDTDFSFGYTNSHPTFADTSDLIPDISPPNQFSLKSGEDDDIYAVIANVDPDNPTGDFLPATIVITENSSPKGDHGADGWKLTDLKCEITGSDGTVPVNTTWDTELRTASIELSYNKADPLLSQSDVTCEFTNEPAPATITVIKNSSGGDDTFNFTWGSTTNTPGTPFLLTTSSGTATTNPVITVTTGLGDTDFFIAEDLALTPGWEFSSASCVDEDNNPVGTFDDSPPFIYGILDIELNYGDDIICTFNNAKPGTVNISKSTVGGLGTFGFTTDLPGTPGFTLTTPTNPSVPEGRTVPAGGGQFTIEETSLPAGWQFTSVVCTQLVDGTPTEVGTIVGAEVTLDVADGETINCLYTNTKDGLIFVDKVTNPSGSSQVFTFTPSWGDDFPLTDGATPEVSGFLTPGSYSVSEAVPVGWDLTDTTCTGQPGNVDENPAAIDLNPGEVVTCRFTNTQRGTITIQKSITVDTGAGPTVEDFDFTGNGPGDYDFGGGFTLSTDVVDAEFMDFVNLLPGDYSVTEASPVANGWVLVGVTCSGESYDDPDTNPATIALGPGEDVICTFTNAPLGSTTIVKNSEGDQGESVLEDFDFDFTWGNGTNPSVPEGESSTFTLNTFGDGTDSKEFNYKLSPLAPYDLAETGLPADVGPYAQSWQLTNVNCDDPSPENSVPDTAVPGANGSDATVVTEVNETVTCTFTNTLDGTLVIRKQTINPDDFDQDFTFVGGVTGTTGDVAGTINDFDVAPVGGELSHTAQPGIFGSAETVPANWEITDISCVGQTDNAQIEIGTAGNFTQPGYNPGDDRVRVDVAAGEVVICTFTNQPLGSLTIVKNMDGVTDNTFNFTGSDPVNDPDIVTSFSINTADPDPDEIVFSGLPPGSYTVVETTLTGYDLSNISCTGASDSSIQIGVTNAFVPGDKNVVVGLTSGEDVICTFENTERASLTVVKEVVNDDGGTAVLDDFSITTSAGTLSWDTGLPSGTTTTYTATALSVVPGTPFSLGETDVTGYTEGNWMCRGVDAGAYNAGSVTLTPGEVVTCTITNDDVAPTLTLVKTVTNDDGGLLTQSDFPSFVNGVAQAWDIATAVQANTLLTASETTQTGYTPSAWGGDCAADGTITLLPGDVKTCTITNDDVAPGLTLVKIVINDDGGNAAPDDFLLTVDGGAVLSGESNEFAANVPLAINETQLPGYTFVSITGDAKCPSVLGGTVTLDEGDAIACTITNDDVAPKLTVTKIVNGGNALPDDFSLTVDGVAVLSGESNEFSANDPLAINETSLPGYTFVSITGDAKCPAVLGGTITLDSSDDITCTLTNSYEAPQGPQKPMEEVPVNNRFALLLLTLMLLATGWYFRSEMTRKF